MKRIYRHIIPLLCVFIGTGCKKYLEEKSNQSLTTINTLQDLQSLLDNFSYINAGPSSDRNSSDDYFMTYADYQALSTEYMRNVYVWNPKEIFAPYTALANDWNIVFNNVYKANVVLDNMDKIEANATNLANWNNIKGQALFLRAFAFYRALTIWSPAYDSQTSKSDFGIPLRLNSDFNAPSVRASVQAGYERVLADLNAASSLLGNTAVSPYRSAKPAALALLSSVYLSMRNYDLAGVYADSCLLYSNKILDYNSLNTSATYPISQFNSEVLYDVSGSGSSISRNYMRVDTLLYSSYEANDLRKAIFFSASTGGTYLFRGSYRGGSTFFGGLSINEVYLTKAECLARNSNSTEALSVLNTLLKNRYKAGTFIPRTATTPTATLQIILQERRKELVFRNVRWVDIKRLNKEGANIALKRILNGTTYSLPANDMRFALPLPEDVITLTGMPQNPR